MRLTFKVRYHTNFGQSLLLTGDHELFGNGNIAKAIPLHYVGEQFWEATIVIPNTAVSDGAITYNYGLRNADGSLTYDWGKDKTISPTAFEKEELFVIDSWNHSGAFENAFYTEPFKNVLLKRDNGPATPALLAAAEEGASCTHTFIFFTAPPTDKQYPLSLHDAAPILRCNTTRPVVLHR